MFDAKGSYEFDYIVMGKRRGYEECEPIQDSLDYIPFQNDEGAITNVDMGTQEYYDAYSEGVKKIFKSNGILKQDGTVNEQTFKKHGWKIYNKKGEKNSKL